MASDSPNVKKSLLLSPNSQHCPTKQTQPWIQPALSLSPRPLHMFASTPESIPCHGMLPSRRLYRRGLLPIILVSCISYSYDNRYPRTATLLSSPMTPSATHSNNIFNLISPYFLTTPSHKPAIPPTAAPTNNPPTPPGIPLSTTLTLSPLPSPPRKNTTHANTALHT